MRPFITVTQDEPRAVREASTDRHLGVRGRSSSGHSVRSRISEDLRSYKPHRSVFEATVRGWVGVAFIVIGILLISLGSPRA